jgi:hypothetical protein
VIVEQEDRRERRQATDFLVVLLGWLVVVGTAALLPVLGRGADQTALFLHLVCLPVAFGAVVMVDVYLARWLFRRMRVRDVLSLAGVAHQVMAIGLGGLIASGIALDPDLQSIQMRLKLLLLLVLMLNAVRMRRATGVLQGLDPHATADEDRKSVV